MIGNFSLADQVKLWRKMVKKTLQNERRNFRRFKVGWELLVRGADQNGERLDEVATLQNLSSGGACFSLSGAVETGAVLELQIKVPFKRTNWMKYSAEVVRVEKSGGDLAVAVKFTTARPVFIKS